MLTAYKVFSRLQGNWSFTRVITNHHEQNLSGVVNGTASFTPVAEDQLFYEENGVFKTEAGHELPIHKEYFYRYNRSTQKLEKHFANNKVNTGLFYVLDANYAGKHLCSQDNYEARYAFPTQDFNEFELSYIVHGPHKDYVTSTKYRLLS